MVLLTQVKGSRLATMRPCESAPEGARIGSGRTLKAKAWRVLGVRYEGCQQARDGLLAQAPSVVTHYVRRAIYSKVTYF